MGEWGGLDLGEREYLEGGGVVVLGKGVGLWWILMGDWLPRPRVVDLCLCFGLRDATFLVAPDWGKAFIATYGSGVVL